MLHGVCLCLYELQLARPSVQCSSSKPQRMGSHCKSIVGALPLSPLCLLVMVLPSLLPKGRIQHLNSKSKNADA